MTFSLGKSRLAGLLSGYVSSGFSAAAIGAAI
jgi:hypothetical protein